MTTPLRLRHPKGVTTVQANLQDPSTVSDLQQLIFSQTEIPPSHQELKSGYPPRTLTLIPELPVSSLGLQRGDQLIVTSLPGASREAPVISSYSPRAEIPPSVQREPVVLPAESTGDDEWVECDGQVLVLRKVPDDNSCLFHALSLVLPTPTPPSPTPSSLRALAARTILAQPTHYTAAFLGHDPKTYAETIQKPQTWGGAIELALFSKEFGVEVWSWDVETGRLYRFGEGEGYDNRVLLVYSGIHYDALSLSPIPEAPPDFHQTTFPVPSSPTYDPLAAAASKLVANLRKKRKFTNTATFDLKCEICGKGLKGEKEAREHAKDTGHAQFGEY